MRLLFLKRCYEHFDHADTRYEDSPVDDSGRKRGFATQESEWVKYVRRATASQQLSPEFKGVAAALISGGTFSTTAYTPEDSMIKSLQPLIESAVAEAPDSYFLQYLLAMLS